MTINSPRRFAITAFAASLLAGLFAGTAGAQDPDFNASLLSNWDGGDSYGDVWGDGNFVYLGHFGSDQVSILDISDPTNQILASTFVVGGANSQASAQDIKVADGLMFVALEVSTVDGVQIVDVRDPYNPVALTTVDAEPGTFEQIHNLFFDQGWLYMVNSSDNTMGIVDLRTFDPDNAPAKISSLAYKVTNIGGAFVHDITVSNGRLYCAAWDSLYVYDVSNLGQQAPKLIATEYGGNCHAVWPTDDGAFVITAEEKKGGGIRLYEMLQNGNTFDLVQRDSVVQDLTSSYSAHNILVSGNRLYVSWYQAGAFVFEINRETKSLDQVAHYDTYSGPIFGFNSCWGIYPYLGEDEVLLSGLFQGSYVVDMSALEVHLPTLPETIGVGSALTLDFDVAGLGNANVDPNAVSVFYSIDGSDFVGLPALDQGGDQFQVSLPAVGCQGELDFYVSVTDTSGRTFFNPGLAPSSVHRVFVTDALVSVFDDDFETDKGWEVFGDATTGNFVRVTPIGTGSKPFEDDPDGMGTMCYLTGQAAGAGGNGSLYDLDDGTTSITSPTFDMSQGDGLIRYATYFYNGMADADQVLIEVSNDAGATWVTLEEIFEMAGGWRHSVHRVSDTIAPTSQMKVRFTVADTINNKSTTDLAVDEFHAEVFTCNTNASVTVRNGSGLNPNCLSSQNLPILGTSWAASVDASALASSTLSYLVSYQNPSSGVILNAGELLLDINSPFFFLDVTGVDANLQATHVIAWPNDPGLVGAATSVQGLLVGGGVQLCNALDLVLDQ